MLVVVTSSGKVRVKHAGCQSFDKIPPVRALDVYQRNPAKEKKRALERLAFLFTLFSFTAVSQGKHPRPIGLAARPVRPEP